MTRITWTDAEWDTLAAAVGKMRDADPAINLVTAAKAAIEQMPESRRRSIQGANQLAPLVERLKQRAIEAKQLRSQLQSAEDRLKTIEQERPDAETVIDGFSDQYIVERFGPIILQRLFDVMARGVPLPVVQNTTNRAFNPQPPKPRKRLPKVCVVGTLNGQARKLERKLKDRAELIFADGNGSFPDSADLYVVWIDFSPHSACDRARQIANSPQRYAQHRGGLTSMAELIAERLQKGGVSC